MRAFGIGGPVGFAHALLGFTASILVARVWESVAHETHCVPACPPFQSQLLRIHHFYYGLGILIPSLLVLAVARRQRLRWDTALFLGIGIGWSTDELGLLFLGVPYTSIPSLLVPLTLGGVLLFGAVNAAKRDDAHEFLVLDRNDILTIAGVLLIIIGVLTLDRPINGIVEITGILSWSVAATLFALSGKKHFDNVRA